MALEANFIIWTEAGNVGEGCLVSWDKFGRNYSAYQFESMVDSILFRDGWTGLDLPSCAKFENYDLYLKTTFTGIINVVGQICLFITIFFREARGLLEEEEEK